jgi:hypothetical protein
MHSEALLDELDYRRVIEDLGIDVSALAPGGEIARRGTRVPRPIGPLGVEVVTISFSMLTVEAPLAGVCGGVGGTMWSKLPSASS